MGRNPDFLTVAAQRSFDGYLLSFKLALETDLDRGLPPPGHPLPKNLV